jgi:hypothetical protein
MAGGERTPNALAAQPKRRRQVPRPFAFRGGAGRSSRRRASGKYAEPAVQLLAYDDDTDAFTIRFCYCDHRERFQRSLMMVDSAEMLDGLREAPRRTPELRALLRPLVS